jgi:hypothetical protein
MWTALKGCCSLCAHLAWSDTGCLEGYGLLGVIRVGVIRVIRLAWSDTGCLE